MNKELALTMSLAVMQPSAKRHQRASDNHLSLVQNVVLRHHQLLRAAPYISHLASYFFLLQLLQRITSFTRASSLNFVAM